MITGSYVAHEKKGNASFNLDPTSIKISYSTGSQKNDMRSLEDLNIDVRELWVGYGKALYNGHQFGDSVNLMGGLLVHLERNGVPTDKIKQTKEQYADLIALDQFYTDFFRNCVLAAKVESGSENTITS